MYLGRILAWVWYYLVPVRRGVAFDNIRRALGKELSHKQQRQVVRRCFSHQALYAVEMLRAPLVTPELSAQLMVPENFDLLLSLAQKRGVIAFMAIIANRGTAMKPATNVPSSSGITSNIFATPRAFKTAAVDSCKISCEASIARS